jgi:hypothetical protein
VDAALSDATPFANSRPPGRRAREALRPRGPRLPQLGEGIDQRGRGDGERDRGSALDARGGDEEGRDRRPSGPQGGVVKLYGYTSDADGIRHALVEDTDVASRTSRGSPPYVIITWPTGRHTPTTPRPDAVVSAPRLPQRDGCHVGPDHGRPTTHPAASLRPLVHGCPPSRTVRQRLASPNRPSPPHGSDAHKPLTLTERRGPASGDLP